MIVTLKKAAALASALAAVSVDIPSTVRMSMYADDDPDEVIKQAIAIRDNAVSKKAKLIGAVYEIRAQIGDKNAEIGISKLLTQRAFIDKLLAMVNSIPIVKASPSGETLVRKREALREKGGESGRYGSLSEFIDVELASEAFVQPQIKELRKERVKVEDKIAELNFKNTIELSKDVVALLTENDLV